MQSPAAAMDVKPSRIDDLFAVVSDPKLLEWRNCLNTLEITDDPKERQKAAHKLKICVGRLARELSTETFEQFEGRLQGRVFAILDQPVSRYLAEERDGRQNTVSPVASSPRTGREMRAPLFYL